MRGGKIDPSIEILKLVDHIATMTRQSFAVECLTRQKQYRPPKRIMLTPAYFRSDYCLYCGNCCEKAKTLVWTLKDWEERVLKIPVDVFEEHDIPAKYYIELIRNAQPVSMMVGNVTCHFMVYLQNKGCQLRHSDNGYTYCGIHPVKPISCGLPTTVFVQMKKSKITYVRKHSNNRWRSKCSIQFGEFDYHTFKYNDLPWLGLMRDLAEDMLIDTYLPDLLRFFKDAEGHFMKDIIPKKNINFMTLLKQNKLF